MNAIEQKYIVGHLDWNSRFRFALGILVSCVLFASIGMTILSPWDPAGAISLWVVAMTGGTEELFLLRFIGLLLVVGVFASIIMDARLPLFGVFAACIGVGIPIIKTASMDYVMVLMQVGKEFEHPQDLWISMILETLGWTLALAILVGGTIATERWLKRSNANETESPETKTTKSKPLSEPMKKTWIRSLGALLITVVLTLFLIVFFAADQRKGQVIFAVVAGFFLAALAAEQITENDHPLWQVVAVPIVAIIAYAYTYMNPERPPGLEAILHIAPNNLARILPIEYIFIGTIGAVFGTWTSHRLRYSKEHG